MINNRITNIYTTVAKNGFQFRNSHLMPNFTHENYKVTRDSYSVLQNRHEQFFKNLLGSNRVITEQPDLEKYNVDWFQLFRGQSTIVLKPKTTEEVSAILRFCNENKLAVCPQGGNTSAVGGGVPVFDEIVLSTELMNKTIDVNSQSGTVVCEAGCILENLDNEVAENGLMIPLDLGAKGSCHIGGNVATNAGGKRLLRYGNLHGNVLGLEVVGAKGNVIDCLNSLKKNNTGLHLKNIFIGSEGTLGLITKVAIQCPPRPKSVHVAFLGCQNYDKVLLALREAKKDLGEILSAFELMDAESIDVLQEYSNIKIPIDKYPFYVLFETSGSNEQHDAEKVNMYLETVINKGYILNGTMSSDETKIKAIWEVREKIPDAVRISGYFFSYDVTLPLKSFYQLVEESRSFFQHRVKSVVGYGHLGDGNLHLNINVHEFTPEIKEMVEKFVIQRTIELKGSISAEHGLGFQKAKYLNLVNDKESYKLMKNLKIIMDPNGILNPYKVFI